MCDVCGCGTPPDASQKATAHAGLGNLLRANDGIAAHNRAHFDACGVFTVNLMSSPGAGKTQLLEATIDALKHEFGLAVIEGDLETENDAKRIRAHGVPALQITTGNACHLDGAMIHDALHSLPLAEIDILFIENVGNLICPACFDLGQHRNVVLLSLTEGDDKPEKYPVMFRAADLVLLTKLDLAPVMDDFDPARAERAVRTLANSAPVIGVSARKAISLDLWIDWLRKEYRNRVSRIGPATSPGLNHDHTTTVAR